MKVTDFTHYERARILGARALQIAMNAPLLIKIDKEDLEEVNYDALKIAEIELNSNILPISIRKPFPGRKDGALRRVADVKMSDEKTKALEEEEEKEIQEDGEIMALANPDDEREESEEKAEEE
jgi:DNA-directed RNA polymerase subunit K/omega